MEIISLRGESPVVEISVTKNFDIVLALPKGRILKEAMPLLARAGIEPEAPAEEKTA